MTGTVVYADVPKIAGWFAVRAVTVTGQTAGETIPVPDGKVAFVISVTPIDGGAYYDYTDKVVKSSTSASTVSYTAVVLVQ